MQPSARSDLLLSPSSEHTVVLDKPHDRRKEGWRGEPASHPAHHPRLLMSHSVSGHRAHGGSRILIRFSCVGPASRPATARGRGGGRFAGFSCLPVEEDGHTEGLVGVCSSQAILVNMLLHLFLRGLRACQAECDMREEGAPPSQPKRKCSVGASCWLSVSAEGTSASTHRRYATCREEGPGFKEEAGEKAIFQQQRTIYRLYRDLRGGVWVRFRNRIKACGTVVTRNCLARTWQRHY